METSDALGLRMLVNAKKLSRTSSSPQSLSSDGEHDRKKLQKTFQILEDELLKYNIVSTNIDDFCDFLLHNMKHTVYKFGKHINGKAE
jgi:hypothetical protein